MDTEQRTDARVWLPNHEILLERSVCDSLPQTQCETCPLLFTVMVSLCLRFSNAYGKVHKIMSKPNPHLCISKIIVFFKIWFIKNVSRFFSSKLYFNIVTSIQRKKNNNLNFEREMHRFWKTVAIFFLFCLLFNAEKLSRNINNETDSSGKHFLFFFFF